MKTLRVFNFNNEECVVAGAPEPIPAKTVAFITISTHDWNAYQATYGDPCIRAGVAISDYTSANPVIASSARIVLAEDDIETTDIMIFFVNTTGDAYAANLPLAADFPVGQRLYLGYAGGEDDVAVTPQEDETIDDELDPIVLNGDSPLLVLVSDGISNWTTI